MAVAALQNDQRLRGKLLHRLVCARPAGIGAVEHRLALIGRTQGFVPQTGKIHIGAGCFFPAAYTLGGRQIEIVRVQDDAGRELPGQPVGKGGLAAAAAAIQRQHQRLCGLLGQCGGEDRGQQLHRLRTAELLLRLLGLVLLLQPVERCAHVLSPSAAALLFYHVSHENATIFGDLRRKSSLLTNRCENHGRNLQLLQIKLVADEKLTVPNVTTI